MNKFIFIILIILSFNVNGQNKCLSNNENLYKADISSGIGISRNQAIKVSIGLRPYMELPYGIYLMVLCISD